MQLSYILFFFLSLILVDIYRFGKNVQVECAPRYAHDINIVNDHDLHPRAKDDEEFSSQRKHHYDAKDHYEDTSLEDETFQGHEGERGDQSSLTDEVEDTNDDINIDFTNQRAGEEGENTVKIAHGFAPEPDSVVEYELFGDGNQQNLMGGSGFSSHTDEVEDTNNENVPVLSGHSTAQSAGEEGENMVDQAAGDDDYAYYSYNYPEEEYYYDSNEGRRGYEILAQLGYLPHYPHEDDRHYGAEGYYDDNYPEDQYDDQHYDAQGYSGDYAHYPEDQYDDQYYYTEGDDHNGTYYPQGGVKYDGQHHGAEGYYGDYAHYPEDQYDDQYYYNEGDDDNDSYYSENEEEYDDQYYNTEGDDDNDSYYPENEEEYDDQYYDAQGYYGNYAYDPYLSILGMHGFATHPDEIDENESENSIGPIGHGAKYDGEHQNQWRS